MPCNMVSFHLTHNSTDFDIKKVLPTTMCWHKSKSPLVVLNSGSTQVLFLDVIALKNPVAHPSH